MNPKKTLLPAVFFPTSVLALDDDALFLDSFATRLTQQQIHIETVTNPEEASQRIRSMNYQALQSFGLSTNDDEEEASTSLQVNFDQASSIMSQLQSADMISTVIVDYDMPSQNGIDFCRQLSDLPIKKVMLTGRADYKLAVDAFNEKIIDHFIVKDPKSIFNDVETVLKQTEQDFFTDISQNITALLGQQPHHPINCPEYQQQVQHALKALGSQQFHLADEHGSMMIYDQHGQKYLLAVRPAQYFEDYLDIATNAEGDGELIKTIASQQQMPILFSEADERQPIDQWAKYMRAMKPISRDGQFYITESAFQLMTSAEHTPA